MDVKLLANADLTRQSRDAWLFLGSTVVLGAAAVLLSWTLLRPVVDVNARDPGS